VGVEDAEHRSGVGTEDGGKGLGLGGWMEMGEGR